MKKGVLVRRATSVLLGVLIGMAVNGTALGGNQSGPRKPVHQAAAEGDVAELKVHIVKGTTNFNTADEFGFTPLMRAIEGRHVEATRLIIESGKANVNRKDQDGKTPLIMAANYGEVEMVEALIANKADLKAKDNNDWTALHFAIDASHRDVAMLLIEKGADINAANKSGMTPLMIARYRDQTEVADLLRQKGATEPVQRDSLYGDYAYGDQGAQAPGAPAIPAREAIELDPNAIRAEIQAFEGLAAVLKAVDDKSASEQQAWIQRRTDNRTMLITAVERQFNEEMAVVKPIATAEKAEKTVKALDDLSAARKKRFGEINEELREQRRAAMASSRDSGMTGGGRAMTRGTRGPARGPGAASAPGYAPTPGYAPAGPYGAPAARTPQRPGAAPVEEPVLDPVTQAQIQVWLNAKPEDKQGLLEAVHEMNLGDLDDLRLIALEEEAKKTAAALHGLMLAHEDRVEKISGKWQEEDERLLKLQERYGPGGMPGRGTQPQQGMRGTRRGGR
jgi:hypothetical protein